MFFCQTVHSYWDAIALELLVNVRRNHYYSLTSTLFMKPILIRNTIFPYLCLFLLAAIGCGSGKVATNMVEGLVTLDGVPLAGAGITFSPVTQGAGMIAVGTSDEQGRFTLQTQLGEIGKGTTEGEYTVTVVKIESIPTGRTITTETGETTQESSERSVVPEMYRSATTTPLKQTIVKGLNKVELALVSKP